MKVIDLLNKIANGEEVPRKIKWEEFELEWEELGYHDYKFLGTGNHLLFQGIATSVLNDEVEVIEEDKKIEKLTHLNNVSNASDLVAISQMQWENNSIIERKINEIIDKINEEK